MLKLVATDLDGTIIDPSGHCDPRVIEAIIALRKKGIRYAICSGRPVSSILPLLKGWNMEGLCDYIIGANGGEVMDCSDGSLTIPYTLSVDLIHEIIDLYEPLGIVPTLYGEGKDLYVQKITEEGKICADRIDMNLIKADIRAITTEPQVKIMFIVDQKRMSDVEDFCRKHPDSRYVGFKTAVNQFECNDPRLNKQVGLEILAEKMGITADNVMAFGDMTNDVEMLAWAKYGICMENGTEDAKAVASDMAPSVTEAGFASYLKEKGIIV